MAPRLNPAVKEGWGASKLMSGAVLCLGRPSHTGAVGAAVERAVRLHAVTYDLYPAMLAGGGKRVDRALEAVERPRLLAGHGDYKGFVIIVTTNVTLCHTYSPLPDLTTVYYLPTTVELANA